MALQVAPINNPLKLSGPVITATPGKNGFPGLVQPSAPAPARSVAQATNANDALTAQTNSLLSQIAALTRAANNKVYAPALNYNAIYNSANASANANVNPYYTKLLNDFVGQQGQARQLQQESTATSIQNLKDQLQQTLQANTVTGQRTTEDTATAEGKVNQAADYRQTDQGTQFTNNRDAEAIKLAQSGLTGSGLAAGQQATTEQTHLTTESRQATADQQSKDAAELTKARTFEDLATSGTLATGSEAKGETAANFDLNKFIVNQGTDLQNKQQELEAQRQGAIVAERQNQIKLSVGNFINSIANPAQRQAAVSAYGGYL